MCLTIIRVSCSNPGTTVNHHDLPGRGRSVLRPTCAIFSLQTSWITKSFFTVSPHTTRGSEKIN